MRTKGARNAETKTGVFTYSATPKWQAMLTEVAYKAGLSRSEYIRRAVESKMAQEQAEPQPATA